MKRRIGVVGPNGRMGLEVAKALAAEDQLEAYFGLDRRGVGPGFTHVEKTVDCENAQQVEAWIDFSSPEAMIEVLHHAVATKAAFVSGTTGITDAQRAELEKASKVIPVLWASNMSMGVAVLNEALRVFSKLKDFDFQIEEVHHNRKKDKPSGTAITLQKNLEEAVGRSLPEPLALRGGGVFGIHKIWAMSDEEVLIFEHSALNRAVFAKGAVRAARWILGQPPGLYGIRDVLLT